jgi:hypothetical protein
MLGNAITTELQLLAARDRLTDLAAAFDASREPRTAREPRPRTGDEAELPACLEHEPLGRPAAA